MVYQVLGEGQKLPGGGKRGMRPSQPRPQTGRPGNGERSRHQACREQRHREHGRQLLNHEVRRDLWEGAGLWREKPEARGDAAHLRAGRPRPLGGPRRRAGGARGQRLQRGLQQEEAPAGTKRAGHGLRRSLAPCLPLQALHGFVFPSPAPIPNRVLCHLSPLSPSVLLPVPATLDLRFLFSKSLLLHLCLYR